MLPLVEMKCLQMVAGVAVSQPGRRRSGQSQASPAMTVAEAAHRDLAKRFRTAPDGNDAFVDLGPVARCV